MNHTSDQATDRQRTATRTTGDTEYFMSLMLCADSKSVIVADLRMN